jgi:YggT family protein
MIKLLRDLLNLVLGLIEVFLVLRFVLKLLAASPKAEFVSWLYANTQPLLQPFTLAFPTPSLKGGFVLEFTTLFALFAYAFVGYLLQQLLEILDKKKK